jgi:DNA-binding CsgD family transcriptional regulator
LVREDCLDTRYWDWCENHEQAKAAFAIAILGDESRMSNVVNVNRTQCVYESHLQPLDSHVMVVSVAKRLHPALEKLTDRERQILTLMPHLETSDIADRLGLSRSTLDTHRAKMRRKLGLKNNAQLVAFAAIHG